MFLPLLFFFYFSDISFFGHSHVIEGVVVVHSHPFSSETHDHSQKELDTISFLTAFHAVEPDSEIVFSFLEMDLIAELEFSPAEGVLSPLALSSKRLRAPPVA